jgi:hypothetical protein
MPAKIGLSKATTATETMKSKMRRSRSRRSTSQKIGSATSTTGIRYSVK